MPKKAQHQQNNNFEKDFFLGETKRLHKGQILWKKGAPSNTICIVEQGELAFGFNENNEDTIYFVSFPGMTCGSTALYNYISEEEITTQNITTNYIQRSRQAYFFAYRNNTVIKIYHPENIKEQLNNGQYDVANAVLKTLLSHLFIGLLISDKKSGITNTGKNELINLAEEILSNNIITSWSLFKVFLKEVYNKREKVRDAYDAFIRNSNTSTEKIYALCKSLSTNTSILPNQREIYNYYQEWLGKNAKLSQEEKLDFLISFLEKDHNPTAKYSNLPKLSSLHNQPDNNMEKFSSEAKENLKTTLKTLSKEINKVDNPEVLAQIQSFCTAIEGLINGEKHIQETVEKIVDKKNLVLDRKNQFLKLREVIQKRKKDNEITVKEESESNSESIRGKFLLDTELKTLLNLIETKEPKLFSEYKEKLDQGEFSINILLRPNLNYAIQKTLKISDLEKRVPISLQDVDILSLMT